MKNGIHSFVGSSVALYCANYIYTGTLVEVCEDGSYHLSNAHIVYETGELTATEWRDAQSLGGDWYVKGHAVESFGKGK